jgi:hypothetical protein
LGPLPTEPLGAERGVDNIGSARGGGLLIFGKSEATLIDCHIRHNNVSASGQGGGIAITESGKLQLQNTTIVYVRVRRSESETVCVCVCVC